MAKILILDDSPDVQYDLEKHIKKHNTQHEIRPCRDCSSVLYELKISDETPIDLFILDLNVNTIGLSDHQAAKTQNGLRTGWVLLMEILLQNDPENINKVVFFSGWLRQLEAYIGSIYASDKEKETYNYLQNSNRLIGKSKRYVSLDPFL